jgi:hypothetical protein
LVQLLLGMAENMILGRLLSRDGQTV